MFIKINGTDVTAWFDGHSVKPYHKKIQGKNQGVNINGGTIFDTVAVKSGFEIKAGLLNQSDYSALVALVKRDSVQVEYDDPDTGARVARWMAITTKKAAQVPALNGLNYYKGITLDFLEV